MTEPAIKINGVLLTPVQAMTIRVAVNSFAIDLTNDGLGNDELGNDELGNDELGNDEHGKEMVKLYQGRIEEINNLIMKND